jgi:hypothetical protein
MMQKSNFFVTARIAGLASLLPFVLFAGPFAGYMAADLLHSKFGAPFYVYYIFCGLGLISGIFETMRIIRFLIREQEKK